LFCRECAVSNLLAQTKELKRLKKEAEKRRAEDEEDKALDEAEAQARAVAEFEQVQAGLSARSSGLGERIVGRKNGKVEIEQDVEGGNKGVKRKFEIDEDELKGLAKQDGKRKSTKTDTSELPSFWVPGKTPDHNKSDLKIIKKHPTCPAAANDKPHDFTLKTLVPVLFHSDDSITASSEVPTRTCPSCNKTLSNGTKAVLAKPCGHVLCKPCSDKFQKPPEKTAHEEHDETVRCYVCQEDVTAGKKTKRKKDAESGEKDAKVERGMVELSSEGTGFAGGGTNMVKRDGVAFQC